MAVSRLTRALLTGATTCLRIRHRADDGYACGTFTLADGAISYEAHPVTASNAPVAGEGAAVRAPQGASR